MNESTIKTAHMRLQKYLAGAGLGARRKCEEYIVLGRVTIDGRRAHLGENVAGTEDIRLDGNPIERTEEPIYIALHKPRGYASDRGDARNRTALDLVQIEEPLHAVGRLDMDSSGLLLLTNDGELSFRLTHPRFEHEKEYHVLVHGHPVAATLQHWREGVLLEKEDHPTLPCQVRVLRQFQSETLLSVVLCEGRKRQIRRMAKVLGHPVVDLMRVRIGPLELGGLESGAWRTLTPQEIEALRRSA
ncbi:MAG: pseudouridine synthase [Chloroflexi bacterium]|nr:pseudouridine synthase [Chloroflexota bacterium]